MVKNDILSTVFNLILANKKLSSKNFSQPSLSNREKVETTIL